MGFDLVIKAYESNKIELEKHSKHFLVSFDDWVQSNWELLVERVICAPNENLEIYGDGSDYEAAAHSRVLFHKAVATHEFICKSVDTIKDHITAERVDLTRFQFEIFVTTKGSWFNVPASFDHVLLD